MNNVNNKPIKVAILQTLGKNFRILIVIILGMLFWPSFNLVGQSIYFKHYQVENGLSNNTVFCSLLDRNGFLWLGTKDGLDCFNGYNFKEYSSEDSSKSLKDSYIRSLYLDSSSTRDILFIGTRIGVFRFDPLKETFDFILKTKGEVDGIAEDDLKRLWVIANKHLICLDLNKGTIINTPATNGLEATAICKTPGGQIWFATANGTLHQLINNCSGIELKSYDVFKNTSHLSPKWIEKIFPMKNGNILIGTSNYGAKLFDSKTLLVTSLITYNSENNGIFARDFKQINDSIIWIASESGIYIYNLHTGGFKNLTQKTGDAYSLSDNAVYSLTVDKEGGIWAGTYSGGLNYFPHPYSNFEKYYGGQGSEGAISGNVVREICQDKYGMLWIGTEDGGLNKLNPKTGKIHHFSATGNATDIAYPNIHALLTYGDTLLIGTFEHGMDILNLKTDKVIGHFPHKSKATGKIHILKSSFIVTLCRTSDGAIYVGTRLGFYRFFPKKDSTGRYFKALIPELDGAFVHTLFVDRKQRIWIGSMGSGLYCYDPYKKSVKKYVHLAKDETSLSNNWVTTIFEDNGGNIWVGTEGGGLCLQNSNADSLASFTRYTVSNGLPSNTIYKILQDDKGLLWLTTSRGLVCWNRTTDKMDVFTTANGLLSDQFNYNSGYKDKAGMLYFGCVKGLIRFNPNTFTESAFTAPLYITSVQAEGQQIASWNDLLNSKLSEDSNRDRTPHYIDIPHKRSSLTIEFAALSYTAPEMIQYQYKLDGLDKSWTYLSSNRKVYFTNLAPGDYTFRVKSTNVSGKWNSLETVLYIRILPTFWESNLAITLYWMIGLGIIGFLFKSYHERQKEKNKRLVEHMAYEKEKELYEAKIDFFTHVTHEIKTPLTLIKAPLEKITKQIDLYPSIQKYIRMIQRNATRLIALSEQLLDFRKTEVSGYITHMEQVDIRLILKEMNPDFKALAKERDLKFKMHLPDGPVILEADKEALTKILTNLLDNGTKYAESRLEAILEIDQDTNQVVFTTINDGPIIDVAFKERIFEPFVRMDTAKSSSGAGLGLSLCRTLARLHQGSLILDTPTGEFNKFVLTLPLGHDKRKILENTQVKD